MTTQRMAILLSRLTGIVFVFWGLLHLSHLVRTIIMIYVHKPDQDEATWTTKAYVDLGSLSWPVVVLAGGGIGLWFMAPKIAAQLTGEGRDRQNPELNPDQNWDAPVLLGITLTLAALTLIGISLTSLSHNVPYSIAKFNVAKAQHVNELQQFELYERELAEQGQIIPEEFHPKPPEARSFFIPLMIPISIMIIGIILIALRQWMPAKVFKIKHKAPPSYDLANNYAHYMRLGLAVVAIFAFALAAYGWSAPAIELLYTILAEQPGEDNMLGMGFTDWVMRIERILRPTAQMLLSIVILSIASPLSVWLTPYTHENVSKDTDAA